MVRKSKKMPKMPKMPKKNKSKKGGILLGKGSFGYIFGKPRLPCKGETLHESTKEVSKLFIEDDTDDLNSDKAYKIIEFVQNLQLESGQNIHDYLLLPSKECDIDTEHKIYKQETSNLDEVFESKLVIYPLAKGDLNSIVVKDKKFSFFKKIMSKLVNIAHGIQILQQNEYIHGDIKMDNCMIHEYSSSNDVYKLGDLDTLGYMDKNTTYPVSHAPEYPCWPFCVILRDFLQEPRGSPIQYHNVPLTPYSDYCISSFRIIIDNILNLINEKLPNSGYISKKRTKTHIKLYIKSILIKIRDEKIISKKESNYNNWLGPWLNYYNNSLSSDEKIKDLYKRVDTYSFGILILEFIAKLNNTDVYIDKFGVYYLCLCIIIAANCCIQTDKYNSPKPPIDFKGEVIDPFVKYLNLSGSDAKQKLIEIVGAQ